jgi:Fe-S-cluster-containing hydrogenase component 2
MTQFELVATGPQAGQRWREIVEPGRTTRIGRAPAQGWAVSWDQRISREHCDVELEGDRLRVRCLEKALNPAHVQGQALRDFTVGEGESFRIGATTFHLGRRADSIADDNGGAPSDNSSLRRLKDEVEQLKAKLAAESEAKRLREEEEARHKLDEVAVLKAQLEQMKAQLQTEPPKKRPDPEEIRKAAEAEALRRAAEEEAREVAEEEARLAAVQAEAKRRIEEAKRKAEDARRREEEAARQKAEEESRQRAEEEARRQAEEEEARRQAEEEAQRKADEEARLRAEEEARQKAEEEARQKAEEEARQKAEEEARKKAEEEARRRAEEEARLAAEAEALRRAEAEARRLAEEEARRKAEAEAAARRAAEELEAKRRAEEAEARRRALEAEAKRLAEEAEALRLAEEEALRLAEEEARRKAEVEARQKAEEEARRKAEEEARRLAEEEARRQAEEEAAARRAAEEAEAQRRHEESEAKRRALEAEAKRLGEEAEALRRAEEEAQRLAAEEARRKAEEDTRQRAEEEARRKAAEEARRLAEEEARRKVEEEAAARRAAEEAEAKRRHEEAEAKRQALEAEAKRLAAEAEALRCADEEAQRLAAEEARRRAEEEAAARRAAEQAEALRRAEEDAKQLAEEQARQKADEEARRKAEEEVAARRAAEEAEAQRKTEEAEAKRIAEQEAADRQAKEAAPEPAAEAPKPTPAKPNLAELKAKLAADAEAKKQAKKAAAAPPEAESPELPTPKKDVQALKEQLAAQAKAKREGKAAAAKPPAADAATPAEPGKQRLDLAALKADLAAKKAAKEKGPEAGAAPEAGRASEEQYEKQLQDQLNRPSISGPDAPGAPVKAPAAAAPQAEPKPKPAPIPKGLASTKSVAPPGKTAGKGKEALAAAAGDNPQKYVWQLLPENVREAVRKIAAGAEATPEDKRQITAAFNVLLKDREFLAAKALEPTLANDRVADDIKAFPKGVKGIKKDWSELEVRAGARLAMQVLYPTTRTKKRKRRVGPPRTLAYLSRSDIFGEMGALLNQPRSATCVAYDHPPDDTSRKPGRVELVRIGSEVFQELITASSGFRARMEQLVAERQERSMQVSEERPWDENSSLKSLPEFQQLGLVQGQKLMLIDLDRCTRCGDCVRACINTHGDGYSRLFLDGPRFDRFLVPSACRKCLNPSCMIGCPVGSIQRGDNDEILIRDWCIGCGLCARQCPYDSIQMHDLGIIPEKSLGWKFQLGAAVTQSNWNQAGFRDSHWPSGGGPFPWDLNLQLPLSKSATTFLGPTLEEAVYFRYEFEIQRSKLRGPRRYRLFLVSNGSAAEVWVNGQAVELPQDAKQKKKGEYEGNLAESVIRPGKNLVAVAVRPPVEFGEIVLSLRLDMPPELTGDAALANELKLVTERAVVCDMCGTRPAGPACVAECPHDAAMRVDAQTEFPRN